MEDREYSYGNRHDKKQQSEPHPDVQRNFEYCQNLLNKIEILEPTLYWKYYDCKDEGYDVSGEPIRIITELKYLFFCWEGNGQKWTGDRSFHRPHEEFKKEIVDAVNFLLQKRFVKRKGVALDAKKKDSVANERRSFSDLFN